MFLLQYVRDTKNGHRKAPVFQAGHASSILATRSMSIPGQLEPKVVYSMSLPVNSLQQTCPFLVKSATIPGQFGPGRFLGRFLGGTEGRGRGLVSDPGCHHQSPGRRMLPQVNRLNEGEFGDNLGDQKRFGNGEQLGSV